MQTSKTNILIVAPYTKRLGIAVFSNADLIHFAVKTLRSPRTIESVNTEISIQLKHLSRKFAPRLVIIKALSKRQRSSEKQQHMARAIRQFAAAKGIESKDVAFDRVKQKLSVEGRPTMATTFTTVRRAFPELARFDHFQNPSQRIYYTSLLSAVAIGFAHYRNNPQDHEISP